MSHLVLIPEAPVDDEQFLARVADQRRRHGLCVVTIAEGVRDREGSFLAERCPAALHADASPLRIILPP